MATTMAGNQVILYYVLVSSRDGEVWMCEHPFIETDTAFVSGDGTRQIPKLMDGRPSVGGYCTSRKAALQEKIEQQQMAIDLAKKTLDSAELGMTKLRQMVEA